MTRSLIKSCMNSSSGAASRSCAILQSAFNTIESETETRSFRLFLQQHINLAFSKGFDDNVGRHSGSSHFEVSRKSKTTFYMLLTKCKLKLSNFLVLRRYRPYRCFSKWRTKCSIFLCWTQTTNRYLLCTACSIPMSNSARVDAAKFYRELCRLTRTICRNITEGLWDFP